MADEPDTPDAEEDVGEDTATQDAADEAGGADSDDRPAKPRGAFGRLAPVTRALVASGVAVTVLAGLTGWLGYRAYEEKQAKAQRDLFIQAARQDAVNLTTISYTEIDTDVQRILDSATGAFRDDFERRSAPFVELVKAAQSKSEGTVTEAGLESQHGDSAQVLVAVAVKSRTAGGEEAPREWRMRIEVKAVGNDAKMSNVVFVP